MNNWFVNLVEECIDLVLCIINDLDLNLIVCLLFICYLVVCVVLSYLLVKGMLKILFDLVVYNCLIYFYFGKSLWYFD